MKPVTYTIVRATIFMCLIISPYCLTAQLLEKLSKSAQETAERTLERKVDRKVEKETEKAIDEVFEVGKKSKKANKKGKKASESANKQNESDADVIEYTDEQKNDIVAGSSFFPDGTILFEEQFENDAQGDFPVNWETNAGGEIIMVNNKKALKLYPNGLYIPDIEELPNNYALEFDLTTANLDYKNLSGAAFEMRFVNEKKLSRKTGSGGQFSFSLWQGSSQTYYINVNNWGPGVMEIRNRVNFNVGQKLNTTAHFTVVVNKKRLRVFIDNQKAIDIPSLLQENAGRYVQFYLKNTDPSLNHIVAVNNIKFTEEGLDIRAMLLKGGFSTTKILFESGSDQLQSSSYSFLDKVGQAMQEEKDLHVMIIGHTDSDGDEDSNRTLSQKRAESVKNFLESRYNVGSERLMTMGKGEADPVANNDSDEGKAQNRRVEFKTL